MARRLFPDDSKTFTITDGPTYSYVYKAAQSNRPTFLLLHGFPSSSYDWRIQIPQLFDAGYGVLVPDLLGYGDTDKPGAKEDYAFAKQAKHIAKILDNEGLIKVIGVGHDWGATLLARLANYQAGLFSALVFMSVPYTKPNHFDLDAVNARTEKAFGYPAFGYWYFFNEDSAAETIEKNVRLKIPYPSYNVETNSKLEHESFCSIVYTDSYDLWKTEFCKIGSLKQWVISGKTTTFPAWLSKEEYDIHNRILLEGGYTGPLNWYKAAISNIDEPNFASIAPENIVQDKPVLFIIGERDLATRAEVAEQAAKLGREEGFLPNVKIKRLNCGHWVQHERADELFSILDRFVQDL